MATAATAYDFARFSISTDTEVLISQDLPWHQRQIALSDAFPQRGISVVVTASTPENVDGATEALASGLSKQRNLFPTVAQPDRGDFFARNGLLFKSLPELRNSLGSLNEQSRSLPNFASDPSFAAAKSHSWQRCAAAGQPTIAGHFAGVDEVLSGDQQFSRMNSHGRPLRPVRSSLHRGAAFA